MSSPSLSKLVHPVLICELRGAFRAGQAKASAQEGGTTDQAMQKPDQTQPKTTTGAKPLRNFFERLIRLYTPVRSSTKPQNNPHENQRLSRRERPPSGSNIVYQELREEAEGACRADFGTAEYRRHYRNRRYPILMQEVNETISRMQPQFPLKK